MFRRWRRQAAWLVVCTLGVSATLLAVTLLAYVRAISPELFAPELLSVMKSDERRGIRVAPDVDAAMAWLADGELSALVDLEPFVVSDATVRSAKGTAEWVAVQARSSAFRLLRVSVVAGRLLTDSDSLSEVLISRAAADGEFGSAADAIGRTLVVNGAPANVVGVFPSSLGWQLGLGETVDLVTSLQLTGKTSVQVVMRSRSQGGRDVRSRISRLIERVPATRPGSELADARWQVGALGRGNTVREVTVRAAFAAVMLVVFITSVNALYAGAAVIMERRGSIVMRRVLGATKPRVFWEEFSSMAVQLLFAIAAGSILAQWALAVVSRYAPSALLRAGALTLRVEWCLLVGILALVISASSTAAQLMLTWNVGFDRLGPESKRALGAPKLSTSSRAFVAVVSGIAVVLSAAALVSVYSLLESRERVKMPEWADVAAVEIKLPSWRFDSRERRTQVLREVSNLLVSIQQPGAVSALASSAPPDSGVLAAAVSIDGATAEGVPSAMSAVSVSPNYFDVLRIEAVAGRLPAENERDAVVVSLSVASMFGRTADDMVGRSLRAGNEVWTVAAVVRDVDVPSGGVGVSGRAIYFPLTTGRGTLFALVRPAAHAEAVEVAVSNIDPDLVVSSAMVSDRLSARMAPLLTVTGAFGSAAVVALALALGGVYAVAKSYMAQNRYAIGMRLALGARTAHLASWLARGVLSYAVVGAVAGMMVPSPALLWLYGGGSPSSRTELIAGVVAGLVVTGSVFVAAAAPIVRMQRGRLADLLS